MPLSRLLTLKLSSKLPVVPLSVQIIAIGRIRLRRPNLQSISHILTANVMTLSCDNTFEVFRRVILCVIQVRQTARQC